jgi:multiple sugar transport system ATP-binding protein
MNLLRVSQPVAPGMARVRVDGAAVDVPLTEASAENALLGVRPEHVRLVAPEQGLRAKVKLAEYFGSHWIAEFDTAGGPVKAVVDKAVRPREGDSVGLAFETERVVLFDAISERLLRSAATSRHTQGMSHG